MTDVRFPPGASAVLNNLTALVAPTVNNDSTQGYDVSSIWMVPDDEGIYQCVDASVGAAVWIQISGGATTIDDFTHPDIAAFDESLIHCWPMVEQAGATLEDTVGSLDLSIVGSGWELGVLGPANRDIADGKGQYGIRRDGTSTAEYIGNAVGAALFGAGDFSISFWALVEETTTGAFWALSNPANNTYLMLSQKTNFPTFGLQDGGADGNRHRWSFGIWTHCVVTRDVSTGDMEVWINGVRRTVDSAYNNVDHSGQGLYLGRQSSSSDNRVVEGVYGEMCIWDAVIDAACIRAICNFRQGRFHG